MPITLSALAANTATLTIPVGADTLTLTYYPNRVNEHTVAMLANFSNVNQATLTEDFHEYNVSLASLIKSWDLLEDDGSMFPLDAARFPELPMTVRGQVFRAIMEHLSPNAGASQAS